MRWIYGLLYWADYWWERFCDDQDLIPFKITVVVLCFLLVAWIEGQ